MSTQTLEQDTSTPGHRTLEFQGRRIPLDEDGHLVNAEDWSEGLAAHCARIDGLLLTEDHWHIIHFIREYYSRYKSVPMPKVLIKGLNRKLGDERFTIKALYALYPDTPLRRSCRYAGVPQPAGCT